MSEENCCTPRTEGPLYDKKPLCESDAVSKLKVAVVLADDARGRIDEVAAACRAFGLDHTVTLAAVGLLTGSMESGDLPKLSTIPGVLMVEVEDESGSGVPGRIQ